jgi:hypothetical protein
LGGGPSSDRAWHVSDFLLHLPTRKKKRIFIELITSDRKLKASREGSTPGLCFRGQALELRVRGVREREFFIDNLLVRLR